MEYLVLIKVPKDWKHPLSAPGNYVNLHLQSYEEYSNDYDLQHEMWRKGLQLITLISEDGKQFDPIWEPIEERLYWKTFEEVYGPKESTTSFLPDWPDHERNCFQMYDPRFGNPVSPVFRSIEKLAKYLAWEMDKELFPQDYHAWVELLSVPEPCVKSLETTDIDS